MRAVAGVFSSTAYGEELKFTNQFTRANKAFRIYPKASKKKAVPMVVKKIDGKALGIMESNVYSSAATSLQWPFSTGQTAPGTLLLTVTDKVDAEKSTIKWRVNFCLRGGKNGSAGRQDLSYPATGKLQSKRLEVTIPPNSNSMQLIVSPMLEQGQSWYLQDVKMQYAPDNVKISKYTPPAGVKPSQWKDVQAADCFFNRHR